mgnify:FL=1|jgi:hypothetical protein|tara:strand:+ start:538 stop:1050 length:513 start_codon:yes stop_codon:yes gene_type:complete
MADRSGYIGRAPGDSSVVVSRQIFNLTGSTTNFTFASGYTPGYLDLYLNGTRLIEGQDYTASDGATIVLMSAGIDGDVVEGVAYKAFNLGDRKIGIQSTGTLIGNVDSLNFVGTGNTFAVNGSTIDVSISSGAASIMTVGVRVGTAVTFTIPSTNTLGVVGRSGTVNVPV